MIYCRKLSWAASWSSGGQGDRCPRRCVCRQQHAQGNRATVCWRSHSAAGTQKVSFVNHAMFLASSWSMNTIIMFIFHLGAVHNCQHFPISTERTEGGGGHDASVLILNVDILIMLPPGGYDWDNVTPPDGLLRNCCYKTPHCERVTTCNASFLFLLLRSFTRDTLGNVR